MTPRHRREPGRLRGALRRAPVMATLAVTAVGSLAVTTAATTLVGSDTGPSVPSAAAPSSSPAATSDAPTHLPLAEPVLLEDQPVGVRRIGFAQVGPAALADIPDAALAAYQRAEGVLGRADKKCGLRWTLLAAVGHVVTGHGRVDDRSLDAEGAMRPRYAGRPLAGEDGRRLPDTDAGRLDDDPRFDRPVGPMQVSPATWVTVGVDADGDGRRDPHDIDDAVLAVAVLLCSAEDPGADLRRVDPSARFVEAVTAAERALLKQLETAPEPVPTADAVAAPAVLPTTPGADAAGSHRRSGARLEVARPAPATTTSTVEWSDQPPLPPAPTSSESEPCPGGEDLDACPPGGTDEQRGAR